MGLKLEWASESPEGWRGLLKCGLLGHVSVRVAESVGLGSWICISHKFSELLLLLEPRFENLCPKLVSSIPLISFSPSLSLESCPNLTFIVRQYPSSIFPVLEISFGFVYLFRLIATNLIRYFYHSYYYKQLQNYNYYC